MSVIWRRILSLTAYPALLIGLPLAGLWSADIQPAPYLEFPPLTQYVEHAPFNWAVFLPMALFAILVVTPFLFRQYRFTPDRNRPQSSEGFPPWGYVGLAIIGVDWILAWTRFEWFSPFQRYTFTPLWIGYVLVVNAWTYRRSGRSLVSDHPLFLLLLFPASAAFWWFFEYLNRFVQNWYYIGAGDIGALQYFLEATLSFSTVLPAVFSTRNLLMTFPRFSKPLQSVWSWPWIDNRWLWLFVGLVSSVGLALIGLYPDLLFPLLWISPFLLWVALQRFRDRTNPLLDGVKKGNWSLVWSSAIAALVCGFFWEMWNYYSMAKWIYSVPYVHAWQIFEMPLMGFAGYLPFGLECAVVVDSIATWLGVELPDQE